MFCPKHLSGTNKIFFPSPSAVVMIFLALELVQTIPPISPTLAFTSTSEFMYVIGKIFSFVIPALFKAFTAPSYCIPSIILAIAQHAAFGITTLLFGLSTFTLCPIKATPQNTTNSASSSLVLIANSSESPVISPISKTSSL